MGDIVLRAQGLGKRYEIETSNSTHDTLRDAIASLVKAPFRRSNEVNGNTSFWALKDVTFEVNRGDVVGIIGRNGAGKSTLLKLLSRITEPSEGIAEIHGRVGSLLEVGTGFHPELSGRENIFLNGAILGMSSEEIQRKLDEIIAFAEIDKFIDVPVKHYSSGMYVRLAFAVAAHLEPEILMVDEVLAVGDAAFQKKCLGKMSFTAKGGKTIMFVSHNMAAVQSLCTKCILLENGKILSQGTTENVIEAYLATLRSRGIQDVQSRMDREGDGRLRWTSVSFHRANGEKSSIFLSGEDLIIRAQYTSKALPLDARITVGLPVKNRMDQILFHCSNEFTGQLENTWPDRGEVICRIPRLPLTSGTFSINLFVSINGIISDWVRDAAFFQVQNADFFGTGRLPPTTHGSFLVPHSWGLEEIQVTSQIPNSKTSVGNG